MVAWVEEDMGDRGERGGRGFAPEDLNYLPQLPRAFTSVLRTVFAALVGRSARTARTGPT